MPSRKVSQEEWAKIVAQGKWRRALERELGWESRFGYLRRHVTVPIVIGVAAILLYLVLYGASSFLKDFLSWVIGITVVTTLLALFGTPLRRRGL